MLPAFKSRDIDPQIWYPNQGTWIVESPVEALTRTPALGQSFFARLFVAYPELEHEVLFLRWSAQDEDTYAFFDRYEKAFAVQFDPDLQYIIVFGTDGTNEIGEWFADPVTEALNYIGATYLRRGPER